MQKVKVKINYCCQTLYIFGYALINNFYLAPNLKNKLSCGNMYIDIFTTISQSVFLLFRLYNNC